MAAPASYITTFNQTDIHQPGFCHYTVCIPVVVAPAPARKPSSSQQADVLQQTFANASSFSLPAIFSTFTSASGGSTPVTPLPTPPGYASASDLAPVLPGCPVGVRRWLYADGDDLVMRFEIRNPANASLPIEVGGLGFSLPIDQYFTGRSLQQIGEQCSFADPYIGGR